MNACDACTYACVSNLCVCPCMLLRMHAGMCVMGAMHVFYVRGFAAAVVASAQRFGLTIRGVVEVVVDDGMLLSFAFDSFAFVAKAVDSSARRCGWRLIEQHLPLLDSAGFGGWAIVQVILKLLGPHRFGEQGWGPRERAFDLLFVAGSGHRLVYVQLGLQTRLIADCALARCCALLLPMEESLLWSICRVARSLTASGVAALRGSRLQI